MLAMAYVMDPIFMQVQPVVLYAVQKMHCGKGLDCMFDVLSSYSILLCVLVLYCCCRNGCMLWYCIVLFVLEL